MSILHRRIMSQGKVAEVAPASDPATPMVMPLMTLTYDDATNTAIYGTAQPMFAPDGGVYAGVSQRSVRNPYPAPVVPAGRP